MSTTDAAVEVSRWYSNLGLHHWATLPVTGPLPCPRYNHAAAVVGDKLFVSGGTRNGRSLSDFHVLDLNTSTWSPSSRLLPPSSAHRLIVWQNKLLTVDAKPQQSAYIIVHFLDLESEKAGVFDTTGELPVAREGQSVTLVGSKLIVFGGEDTNRKLLNDIHILNLDTLSWEKVLATQPPPSPRYDHATAVHADRYFLVFGGCSHSTCFNDLHVLDLHTMEWSEPETRGDYVAPRAGHSGVTVDGNWYIIGGGDNKSGARETLVLDMNKLAWSAVATVNPRDPLASEGISICSALIYGATFLVAFGGYNGRYNNEVFIMRPKLKDTIRPKIYQSPAAAAAAASVSAAYLINSGKQSETLKVEPTDTDVLRAEKERLESSLAAVRTENSTLKGKIDDTNSTHVELAKELESVQGQLIAERSRCFSLEAQIARFQGMLELLPAIETEHKSLSEQKSSFVQDAKVEKQASGGVWQWFSGE